MAEESGGGGALRELLAYFDIKVGQEGLEKATLAIDSLKNHIAEFGEIALGAFAVEKIKEFVKETVEMGEEIANTSKHLGVSTDELQLFRGELELSGAHAEDATLMFSFFNKAVLGSVSGNADAAVAFQKLGIKTQDASGKLITLTGSLEDIAGGLEKVESPTEKAKIKMELFGKMGGRLNEAFEKGAEGIRDLKKEVIEASGVLDSDFIAKSKIAGDEMKKVDMVIRSLKVTLITEFMPGIRTAIMYVRDAIVWFKGLAQHTYIVKEALAALAAVGLMKVLKALMEIKSFFGAQKAEGLLETLLGMGEIGIILLVVGALYLIFDDLFNLFKGNKSLIGDTLNDMLGFDKAGVVINNLKEAWTNLTKTITDLGIELPSMMTFLTDIVLCVVVIVEWWVILEQTVAAILNTIYAIGKALSTDMTSGHWMDDMKKQFADWDRDTDKNYDRISKAFDGATSAMAAIPASWAKGNLNGPGTGNETTVTINYMGKTLDATRLNEADRKEWNDAVVDGTQAAIDKAFADISSRTESGSTKHPYEE